MTSTTDLKLAAAIEEATMVLQPIFTRPKLRSRLLAKPPFRFIHDIVMSILESTNFPTNLLFTDVELDSSSFKENKQAKLAFLDKLVALVNVIRESPVEVDSRNIVAGVKPVATLSLLVEFGKLAQDEIIDHASLIQSTNRIEIAEEETKEDSGESEASHDDEEDFVDETKEDCLASDEVYKSMSTDDLIDHIVQSASIIENLFTE
jgi:TRAF3-interacting protein 1